MFLSWMTPSIAAIHYRNLISFRSRLSLLKLKNKFKKTPCQTSCTKSTSRRRMSRRRLRMIRSSGSTMLPWSLDGRASKIRASLPVKAILMINHRQSRELRRSGSRSQWTCRRTTRYLPWWPWSIRRDRGRLRTCKPKKWHRAITQTT